LPQLEPSWLRRQRKRTATGVLLHGSRLTGRAPARALRFGSCDEPLPYVEDLARFWKQARWESRDGSLDYLGAMKTIHVPVLSILGAGDTLMAHPVAARAWMEVHGPEHTQTWVVGRSEAVPFDPDHMGLVTDLRARPVWEKLSRWMKQVSDPKRQ
jgi:pimeloyl-ACP methyl ester carboxylesterase